MSERLLAIYRLLKCNRETDLRGEAVRIESWCAENAAAILYPGHPDYPFTANDGQPLPPFLTCWGSPVWRDGAALAIVGSREPSPQSLHWLETHLPGFLRTRAQASVVSGGARGIDQRAHWLAIRAGRPTVVFLPSGLAKPYPPDWQDWKQDVLDAGGAILSMTSPFQEVRRSLFERRNRLIASMGRLLFVVEARRRSGSSMTARLATELDRTICCLPGGVMDPRCAGSNDLLVEGAFAIRDGADLQLLYDLSRAGYHSAEVSAKPVLN